MRSAIGEAQNLALSADHQRLTPEHLMLALIAEEGTIATTLIDRSGGDSSRLREALEKTVEAMPTVTGSGAVASALIRHLPGCWPRRMLWRVTG